MKVDLVDEDDLDDGVLDDNEVREQALALMNAFDKDGEALLDREEMAQIKAPTSLWAKECLLQRPMGSFGRSIEHWPFAETFNEMFGRSHFVLGPSALQRQ